MKFFLILLLLVSSMAGMAQIPDMPLEDIPSGELADETYYEDSFESEMFIQKQENFSTSVYPTDLNQEEYMIEEEVYDSESEY